MSNKKLKPIPKFKNEDEERDFWATTDTSEYFDYSKMVQVEFPHLKPTNWDGREQNDDTEPASKVPKISQLPGDYSRRVSLRDKAADDTTRDD